MNGLAPRPAFGAAICSGGGGLSLDSGEPFAVTALWCMSSGKPMQRPASWRGWLRRSWSTRLSGTTLRLSTAARGVALWISSLQASRASHGATPGNEKGHRTSVGSGTTLLGWFARLDPASSSWKTPQVSLMAVLSESSPIWPRAGSMRNGTCFELPTSEHRIDGSGSSFWPTPDSSAANDSEEPGSWKARRAEQKALGRNGNGIGLPLATAAKLWTTPTATDAKTSGSARYSTASGRHAGETLSDQLRNWPTPTTAPESDNRGSNIVNGPKSLGEATSAFHQAPPTGTDGSGTSQRVVLNPEFVEALMGWPIGWTDCAFAETGSSHSRPPLPSASSPSAEAG